MNASSSAIDSALWLPEAASAAIEPCQAVRQTLDVIILDIALPGQGGLGAVPRLRGEGSASRVLVIRVHDKPSGQERRIKLVQTEVETRLPISQPIANPKRDWVRALIYTLLIACCAATLLSVFQGPFRLLANDDSGHAVKLRTEIAALPAGLGTQTMSRSRASRPRQNAGYNNAGNPVDESSHKRKLRDRSLPQKSSPVGIDQWSERK